MKQITFGGTICGVYINCRRLNEMGHLKKTYSSPLCSKSHRRSNAFRKILGYSNKRTKTL